MRGAQGFILPAVLAVMVVALLMGALAFLFVSGNLRNTQATIVTSRAHLAAEAGLEEAAAEVWHRLLGDVPRSQRTIQEYVTRVERWMGSDSSRSLEGELPDGGRFRVVIQPLGRQVDSGNRLVAYRFRVRSEGRAPGGGVRVLEQTFWVGRRFFPFDYALLTNNLNCILCHANISSLDRLRGSPNPNNRQTWWRRAKVATLEHIEAPAGTNSVIHGTMYTGGTVTLRYSGDSPPTLYSTLEDGRELITSLTLRQVGRHFQPVDCSDPANCPSRRPLYQNYPSSQDLGERSWPDGELVDSFPLPLPDANGNRRIDDEEWASAVQGSLSGSSDEYPPGRLKARMAVFTAPPAALGWQVAATTQEVGTDTLADNPRKLVVIDAQAQPLEISGTLFINGDVILRGRVRGNGTLLARGNIYVMGDLVYDCGQGSQTRDCNYSSPSRLPALSLVAGGNVVVGDYLSRFRLTDNNIPDATFAGNLNNPLDVEAGFEGGFAQTYSGCVDFWAQRTSQQQRSDWVRKSENSGARCTVPNLVAMEVGNFNRLELLKASQALARGERYVPRFYRFEGDEGIFYYHGCGEHTRLYEQYRKLDGSTRVNLSCGGQNDSFRGQINLSPDQVRDLLSRAVVVDVHTDWLPKQAMKALWIGSVQGNPARPQGPLRVDGLIYTPNAVFSLAPGDGHFSRTNGDQSKVQGRLDMRGGIVAADTGILAPRGFDLYHDSRLRPRVPYDQNLTLVRGVWKVSRR